VRSDFFFVTQFAQFALIAVQYLFVVSVPPYHQSLIYWFVIAIFVVESPLLGKPPSPRTSVEDKTDHVTSSVFCTRVRCQTSTVTFNTARIKGQSQNVDGEVRDSCTGAAVRHLRLVSRHEIGVGEPEATKRKKKKTEGPVQRKSNECNEFLPGAQRTRSFLSGN
jgi:hypothetical protein